MKGFHQKSRSLELNDPVWCLNACLPRLIAYVVLNNPSGRCLTAPWCFGAILHYFVFFLRAYDVHVYCRCTCRCTYIYIYILWPSGCVCVTIYIYIYICIYTYICMSMYLGPSAQKASGGRGEVVHLSRQLRSFASRTSWALIKWPTSTPRRRQMPRSGRSARSRAVKPRRRV